MQVDWLTVGAQWINFLVLMWLLRRYLYRPIVEAMDRRRRAIEANMAEARAQAEQAAEEAREYRDKLGALEAHRAHLMAAAREEAERERERLTASARAELADLKRQWRHEVEREKNEFRRALRLNFGRWVAAAARKALHDLTSLELEQALFAHFLRRLQCLPESDKRLLAAAGVITLASSAELSAPARAQFVASLHAALAAAPTVHFEPLPDSPCGMRLSTPTYTLEWSLEQYFAALEDDLEQALSMAHAE